MPAAGHTSNSQMTEAEDSTERESVSRKDEKVYSSKDDRINNVEHKNSSIWKVCYVVA